VAFIHSIIGQKFHFFINFYIKIFTGINVIFDHWLASFRVDAPVTCAIWKMLFLRQMTFNSTQLKAFHDHPHIVSLLSGQEFEAKSFHPSICCQRAEKKVHLSSELLSLLLHSLLVSFLDHASLMSFLIPQIEEAPCHEYTPTLAWCHSGSLQSWPHYVLHGPLTLGPSWLYDSVQNGGAQCHRKANHYSTHDS